MSCLLEEIKESIDILSETKMINKEQKTDLLVKLEKGNWFNWKKDGDLERMMKCLNCDFEIPYIKEDLEDSRYSHYKEGLCPNCLNPFHKEVKK